MSKFNKKTLAAALVAALAVPTAYAFTIHTGDNADPEVVATQVGDAFTMTEPVQLVTEFGDAIIGRTTGMQMIVTLIGAEFAAPATMAAGGAADDWTANLVAGGAAGDTAAQFTFTPNEADSTIDEGVFAVINDLSLQNASGNVSMQVIVRDSVGGNVLHDATRQIVLRENGLDLDCTAEKQPLKIDVGGDDPRHFLVDFPYEIGAGTETEAALGYLELSATGGFEFDGETEFLSTITTDADGGFANFNAIWLSSGQSCETRDVVYDIDVATNTASFEGTGVTPGSSLAGTLCVEVSGEGPVVAQTLTFGGSVNGASVDSCPVAPLAYNGSLVKVYHVNPAGNTQAQSFVRVINQSQTGGNVTVTGYDDAGNEAGPVKFFLGARESLQLNSVDLEEGNTGKGITGSFGDGVGKWRLEVLGEFDNMVVQGLNRNRDTGTVTNLTDADGQEEQNLLHRTSPRSP